MANNSNGSMLFSLPPIHHHSIHQISTTTYPHPAAPISSLRCSLPSPHTSYSSSCHKSSDDWNPSSWLQVLCHLLNKYNQLPHPPLESAGHSLICPLRLRFDKKSAHQTGCQSIPSQDSELVRYSLVPTRARYVNPSLPSFSVGPCQSFFFSPVFQCSCSWVNV